MIFLTETLCHIHALPLPAESFHGCSHSKRSVIAAYPSSAQLSCCCSESSTSAEKVCAYIALSAACCHYPFQKCLRLLCSITCSLGRSSAHHVNAPHILHVDHRIPACFILKFLDTFKPVRFQSSVIRLFLRQIEIVFIRPGIDQNGVVLSGKMLFAAAAGFIGPYDLVDEVLLAKYLIH